MRVLEIVRPRHEVLEAIFGLQREVLREKVDLVTVDTPTAEQIGKADVLLLREIADLPRFLIKKPVYVDFTTGDELGRTSDVAKWAHRVSKAFCYSPFAYEELMRLGASTSMLRGPFLPDVRADEPPGEAIGVLDTSSMTRQVLRKLVLFKGRTGRDHRIVSTVKHRDVEQVGSEFEVAEQARVIVAPYDDMDFGEPHLGAVLALCWGRALVTARTSSLENMPYTADTCFRAISNSPSEYAGGVEAYLRNPDRYDKWPRKLKIPDMHREFPLAFLREINA